MSHEKYKTEIAKQLPQWQSYKPRMGLHKKENFFFETDSEFNKEARLRMLAANASEYVSYKKENKDLVIESLGLFYLPLQLVIDRTDKSSVEQSFFEIAKASDSDIILLDETKKIIASAVCFPSGWEPKEKLGNTVDEAHGVIPDVNSMVGSSINKFLDRLAVGELYTRSNIGFIGEDILDCRPSKQIKKLTNKLDSRNTWIRLENQGIVKLPNGHIVFGIKVENIPLHWFIVNSENKNGLREMLTTMPESMAVYKGISGEIRSRLIGMVR